MALGSYLFGTVKFEFLLCHPGLEPGSRSHSRSWQKAVLNAGSRVFARDDKEGTTTKAIHTSSGRLNNSKATVDFD
jgi:hypothetical protein